jgi:hypothetical protein
MWYAPEHVVAFTSVLLLTPTTLPHAVAGAAPHATVCDAPVPRLPASIEIEEGLQDMVRWTLEHSPTFRQQCRVLASATRLQATLRVSFRPVGSGRRARAVIRAEASGAVTAAIEIHTGAELPEMLGHELEHVIEQIDGVNLRTLERHGDAHRLEDGAFETKRALLKGRRVSAEVADNAPDGMRRAGRRVLRIVGSLMGFGL